MKSGVSQHTQKPSVVRLGFDTLTRRRGLGHAGVSNCFATLKREHTPERRRPRTGPTRLQKVDGVLMGRLAVRCFAGVLVFLLGLSPAIAQRGSVFKDTAAVDVDLVLAIDASGSVEEDRFELQKRGFGAAFRDPKVLQAIRAGDHKAIAVFMLQWTGPAVQAVMVPWTMVTDERSADALASAIEASPRRLMGGGTSISGAIDFSVKMFSTSPYPGTRRVIDISGDGSNNIGRPAEQARDEAVAIGIRINGLPILTVEPDLDQYFRKSVVGGPGAFVIPAKNYDQFSDAILRKLITEIAQSHPDPTLAMK
jgi:hypothetical protein